MIETQGKEAPMAALCAVVFTWIAVRNWDRQGWPAIALGSSAGLLLLVFPGFILPMFVLVALAILRGARWQIATWIVCVIVVLTPWTIRNYQQFGHVFFIRDNLGLELAIANTERHYDTHPWVNLEEARKVIAMGEYDYHQSRGREAKAWIAAHPAEFAKSIVVRAFVCWFPLHAPKIQLALYSLLDLLALAGLWLIFRTNPAMAVVILLSWAAFTIPYSMTHAEPRYMYPILWSVYLVAGYLIRRNE